MSQVPNTVTAWSVYYRVRMYEQLILRIPVHHINMALYYIHTYMY